MFTDTQTHRHTHTHTHTHTQIQISLVKQTPLVFDRKVNNMCDLGGDAVHILIPDIPDKKKTESVFNNG